MEGAASAAPASVGPVTTLAVPTAATTTPCAPGAPLETVDPSTQVGCPFAATTLTATDVPADEGFWAATTNGTTVWVHLIGLGESDIEVTTGPQLTMSGRIVAAPPDPADALPADDPRILELGWYLGVRYEDLHPS